MGELRKQQLLQRFVESRQLERGWRQPSHEPAGGGSEFRFLRVESNGSNLRNIAALGTGTSFIAESNFGVGTTTPAARLDVAGRILRNSSDFSLTGTAVDNAAVTPPWGTTDDWNIFVSPYDVGQEEGLSEGDNALLRIYCSAAADVSKTFFRVSIRYKYRKQNTGEGTWYAGTANYLLIPR